MSIFFVLFFLLVAFTATNSRRMSMNMENKTYRDGKYTSIKADIFFKLDNAEMVSHFYYPDEYILITTATGESKIYYPEKNEVYLAQNAVFSTEKSMLYYFISNQMFDLGIQSFGFTLDETLYEGQLMVSIWLPLPDMPGKIGKIKIVHEDGVPIYSSYFDKSNVILNKVYFTNYKSFDEFMIPSDITEISYITDTDSIVSKISYRDIKFGHEANSEFFDYKIPEDAKIIEQ